MTTQLSEALRFTRTPQPTHCKPELLPISKSQVYQDTTAHSLQTGFTTYRTDSLFRFTRTPQPTHCKPELLPISKSQVYQDATAHSLQIGFTPYHTDILFRFTRIPQPTHVTRKSNPCHLPHQEPLGPKTLNTTSSRNCQYS